MFLYLIQIKDAAVTMVKASYASGLLAFIFLAIMVSINGERLDFTGKISPLPMDLAFDDCGPPSTNNDYRHAPQQPWTIESANEKYGEYFPDSTIIDYGTILASSGNGTRNCFTTTNEYFVRKNSQLSLHYLLPNETMTSRNFIEFGYVLYFHFLPVKQHSSYRPFYSTQFHAKGHIPFGYGTIGFVPMPSDMPENGYYKIRVVKTQEAPKILLSTITIDHIYNYGMGTTLPPNYTDGI